MDKISKELVRGEPGFTLLAPPWWKMFKVSWVPYLFYGRNMAKVGLQLYRKEPLADVTGSFIANQWVIPKLIQKPAGWLNLGLQVGMNRLGNVQTPGVAGREVRNVVVMFHDADKAGPHLDVHLGRTSLIYRIPKDLADGLVLNGEGKLTEASRNRLAEFLREQVRIQKPVPQNRDHTVRDARTSWLHGEEGLKGYGAGKTRQPILEGKAEVYWGEKDSLHLFFPELEGSRGLYFQRVFQKKGETPIVVLGKPKAKEVQFEDRLHLKLVQPIEFQEQFLDKVDPKSITRKYDGSSTYFTFDGRKFRFYSPRISTVTGERIEYTHKLPELIVPKEGPKKVAGMGELLFWKPTTLGRMFLAAGIRGPEKLCWNYLPAANIGGILNGKTVREQDVYPELRIYRVDEFEGEKVSEKPFFENRRLQQMVAKIQSPWMKVVKLVRGVRKEGEEGLVGVPQGKSVHEGRKVKWLGDEEDWKATKVELSLSEKGNIQGVIWFQNPEGKAMKLGPGQLGSFDECSEIMENPKEYEGRTAKVVSRIGHSGRSAKLQMWHDDK